MDEAIQKPPQNSDESAELRRMLRGAEDEIGKVRLHSIQELQSLRSELGTALRDCQSRVSERFREIALLTALLGEQEKSTEATQARVDWLRQLALVLMSQPAWWGLMPSSWRHRRQRRLLRERALFEDQRYLELNPDVAVSGMDPLFHYVFHGINEGRPRLM